MSIGKRLARVDSGKHQHHQEQQQQQQQHAISLHVLDEQISKRASKSHEELFEICPLEQAHLLSQKDTENLADGSDTKSLVYGEIDFWSFYDVMKVAAHGIYTETRCYDGQRQDASGRESPPQPSCRGGREEEEDDDDDGEGGVGMGGGGEVEEEEMYTQGSVEVEEEEEEQQEEEEERWQRSSGRVQDGRNEPRNVGCDGGSTNAPRRRLGAQLAMRAAGISPGERRDEERGEGGLKFYDLGSGSGKALFAAVLAVDCRCAVGIEVLAGVYRASTRVLKRYRRLVEPVFCTPADIELRKGSFLDPTCDWSDGDLVFANSTCFAEDTLLAIAKRAELLRPGARVVTFTTALKTLWLRVLTKRRYQM
ncbi:unnamed protein product, partial [Ectocarpus sp. 13 AM-2016]